MTTIQEVIDHHGLTIHRTYREKSSMTAGRRYNVTVRKGDEWINFGFHDNKFNNSTPAEMFSAHVGDALAFLGSTDIDDFSANLGIEKISEAIRAYDGCREALNSLYNLGLTDAEILGIELL